MLNSKKNKRSAFTLIELSVVLVIIGLLITAITSGSGIIRNAKLRALTNEAREFQVAVNSFFMKFDQYPGDINAVTVSSNSGLGDGDDLIEWQNGTINEAGNAWINLIQTNMISVDLDVATNATAMKTSTGVTLGTHFPRAEEDGAGWIFGSSTDNVNNLYLISSVITGDASTTSRGVPISMASTGAANIGALLPSDAYSLDKKNDDGDPLTGSIKAAGNGSATASTNCYHTTGSYNVANDTEANKCPISFKVSLSNK